MQKKNCYVASVKYMIKPMIFAFILGSIVTVIVSFFLPTLIDFFLPKYSESAIILGVLIFQLLFRLLASPLSILSISLKYKNTFIFNIN